MDGRKICALTAIIVLCAGCHHGGIPEFPDWVSHAGPMPEAKDSPSSAFNDYVRAADEAEKDGGKYLDMVSFYPGQRVSAMQATTNALSILDSASSSACDFDFKPLPPFSAPPHQRGWRLLGRDLVWKIQEAVQANDLGTAIANANIATKFGFDLCGGGAIDASLGLAIVDDARKAIAPAMDSMDATQLKTLADGIGSALNAKPPMSEVIQHEHLNMMMGVQAIQSAYQNDSYDAIRQNLGADSRAAVEYLQELHSKDSSKRPHYFEAFAAEGDAEAQWMASVADLPVAQRAAIPEPRFKGERPWKRFSRDLFFTLKPLLEMNDQTLARTRLMIITADVMAQVKTGNAAPKDLSAFPEKLRTDPYSGNSFIYAADGTDFHVYSVGADLRDDGGETDDTYTQPDLKLERG